MHPNTRAAIAYIVSALANGKTSAGVFDYAQCKSYFFSGNVSRSFISLLDLDRLCQISGQCDRLYDQGRKAYVSLSLGNNHFTGYDMNDSIQFCGDVNDHTVTFNELGAATRFSFRVF